MERSRHVIDDEDLFAGLIRTSSRRGDFFDGAFGIFAQTERQALFYTRGERLSARSRDNVRSMRVCNGRGHEEQQHAVAGGDVEDDDEDASSRRCRGKLAVPGCARAGRSCDWPIAAEALWCVGPSGTRCHERTTKSRDDKVPIDSSRGCKCVSRGSGRGADSDGRYPRRIGERMPHVVDDKRAACVHLLRRWCRSIAEGPAVGSKRPSVR